jgi:hypothetical protein
MRRFARVLQRRIAKKSGTTATARAAGKPQFSNPLRQALTDTARHGADVPRQFSFSPTARPVTSPRHGASLEPLAVKKLKGFTLEEKATSPKNGSQLQTVGTLWLNGTNVLGLRNGGNLNGSTNAEPTTHSKEVNGHTTTLKAGQLESRAASRKNQWGAASVDAWDDSTRAKTKVLEAAKLEAQPRVRKRDQYDAQYDAGKKRHKSRQALGPAPGLRAFDKAEAANAKWAADNAALRRQSQAVAANRYDSMNEDDLLVNLESTLSSALSSEARGDADAAVAKTAAIKNIQKALTARILKRLDDGQPLVEVARKMKAIEGMQPQINDMERRLGIMQSVEPVLENAIKTLQKVVDVRGMGKK